MSGERRKPKPSGRTSSVPSPKMLSPFFACCFSMAKMRSCLRIRLAPSSSLALAISTSSVTGLDLSSDRCMVARGKGGERRRAAEGNAGKLRPGKAPGRAPESSGGALEPAAGPPREDRGAARHEDQVAGSEVAVNKGGELRLRQRADLLRVGLAALEQDQRRDAADAELARGARVGVDVELGDRELARVVAARGPRAPARSSCRGRTTRPSSRRGPGSAIAGRPSRTWRRKRA